jgi:predicted nicotinamide N-methyase
MTAADRHAALAREYSLLEATYKVAGFDLRITSVRNSYELLDKISPDDFVKDEQMPYWAELWPSSFLLSKHLVEIGVAEKSCIELGAGVGMTSVALAKVGAKILATDYSEEAIPFIELNALQNGITLSEQFRVMPLDWRNIQLRETFDIVFAADVLYERRNLLPITLALDKLLRPTGTAYIADPRRAIANGFLPLAKENGFDVATLSQPLDFGNRRIEIDIYIITRNT